MSKKRRKKGYHFLAFFLVLFLGGGIALYVYGQTTETNTATNTVTVGKVDVELAMSTHDAGVITPGAISNTVTVENVGDYPAYIRMFVKKYWQITEKNAMLTSEQIVTKYPELSVDAIDIKLKDGWTKGASSSSYLGYECYYYNQVVDTGKKGVDAICFSDSYELHEGDAGITNELLLKFTKNEAKVYGYYSVIVEAIQADTCIPEHSTVDGKDMITSWNDIPSTLAPVSTVYIDPAAISAGMVNFKSENTEISNADSFIDVNSLLPGKTEERVVEIKNTSDQTLPVYVYAESAEEWDTLDETQKAWLEQLQLVIGKEDGTVLYQDSLYKPNSDEPMLSAGKPILIDNFSSNTSQKLYVAISCPASWTKGDVQVKVNWIFASKRALPTRKPSVVDPSTNETDIPEKTSEPTDTPVATVLEETKTPVITDVSFESPQETNVIVTDSPLWDGNETLAPETELPITEPPQTEPPETQPPDTEPADTEPAVTQLPVLETPAVTDDNVAEPEPSSGMGMLVSEDPNTPALTQSPKTNSPTNNLPQKTSTPKQPTKVEVLYPTKTGDLTPIVVWLVLFVVSWIGMISIIVAWRRSR